MLALINDTHSLIDQVPHLIIGIIKEVYVVKFKHLFHFDHQLHLRLITSNQFQSLTLDPHGIHRNQDLLHDFTILGTYKGIDIVQPVGILIKKGQRVEPGYELELVVQVELHLLRLRPFLEQNRETRRNRRRRRNY